MGVTFTCQYEPVKAVHEALDKLQQETGLDIPMHVDSASGGFLAPFCASDIEWDFRQDFSADLSNEKHASNKKTPHRKR